MADKVRKNFVLPAEIAEAADLLAQDAGGKGQHGWGGAGALLMYIKSAPRERYAYSSWAMAIQHGQATIHDPPQFDIAKTLSHGATLAVYHIQTGPFAKGSLVRRGEATIWTAEDVEAMGRDERRHLIPVLARTAAGLPMADSDLGYPPGGADEYVEFKTTDRHAFGLRLVGDSMEPHFHEGDIVIFGSQRGPSERMAGVMIFKSGGVSTFKIIRLCTGEGYNELIPLNEKYPTERIAIDQMGRVLPAIGVVTRGNP